MSDKIHKIITHKFEDGVLLYLIEFTKIETGELSRDWVDASIVHENFQNYLNYWERQKLRRIPFGVHESESITIDSYDISNDSKKTPIFAVHMEGNGLDEYHLLSRKQMLDIPDGQREIDKFYEKVLGINQNIEHEYNEEEET